MTAPGKGRYTDYIPTNSEKRAKLSGLFNARADNGAGAFYGDLTAGSSDAAAAVSEKAAELLLAGKGDTKMFPNGVDMTYGAAPNIAEEVKFSRPGDPANAYVPDLRSPGATGVDGVVNIDPKTRADDPNISPEDIKPNMVRGLIQKFDRDEGTPGSGTVSPSTIAGSLTSPIGRDLQKGKSAI